MQLKIIKYMSSPTVNWLLSKNIHISYSHNPDFSISEDPITKKIGMSSTDNENPRKINMYSEGDSYTIMLNGSHLCVSRGILKKCKKTPAIFDFAKSKFGFKIVYRGKCLTIDSQLKFAECDETNKMQEFVFKNATKYYCKESPFYSDDKLEGLDEDTRKRLEKKLVNKKLEKHGIKSEPLKKNLSKLWAFNKRRRGWGWPWGWPNICKI